MKVLEQIRSMKPDHLSSEAHSGYSLCGSRFRTFSRACMVINDFSIPNDAWSSGRSHNTRARKNRERDGPHEPDQYRSEFRIGGNRPPRAAPNSASSGNSRPTVILRTVVHKFGSLTSPPSLLAPILPRFPLHRLACRVLHLEPILGTPQAVGWVPTFGHDALEPSCTHGGRRPHRHRSRDAH